MCLCLQSIAKGDQQKPPAVKRKKVEPVPVEDDEEKEVARVSINLKSCSQGCFKAVLFVWLDYEDPSDVD